MDHAFTRKSVYCDVDHPSMMQLYTGHIAGPVVVVEDIDAAVRENMGNTLPPPSEAEAFFGVANRQLWQAVAANA
jgi:hypothetical protein